MFRRRQMMVQIQEEPEPEYMYYYPLIEQSSTVENPTMVFLTQLPNFVQGNRYRIRMHYRIIAHRTNITTAYARVYVVNAGAFAFQNLKLQLVPTEFGDYEYEGDIDTTVTSTLSGGFMSIGGRFDSQAADFTLTDLYIEDVTNKVIDDFNRADSTSLGSTPTGNVWSAVMGSFGISSNKCVVKVRDSNASTARVLLDPGWSDYEVSLKCKYYSYFGIPFRVGGNNNDFLMARMSSAGLGLYRFEASLPTSIAQHAGFVPVAGTVYHMRIVAKGSSVQVYLDGVLVISVVEKAYTSQRVVGIQFYGPKITADEYDDFEVRKL